MMAGDKLQIPPWRSPRLWREINNAITVAVERRNRRLEDAARRSRQLAKGIMKLNRIMDTLCDVSCPVCSDVCCERAMIWYDFKDLVCLHLAGLSIPVAQIVRHPGQLCPNQGIAGCTLPRIVRPFICNWYLCPPQKTALHRLGGAAAGDVMQSLANLKQDRIEIEALFVQAVSI